MRIKWSLMLILMYGFNLNQQRQSSKAKIKNCIRIWKECTEISRLKSKRNSKRGKKRKNNKANWINLKLWNLHSNMLHKTLPKHKRKFSLLRKQMLLKWMPKKIRKRNQKLWEPILFFRMSNTPLRKTRLINRSMLTKRNIPYQLMLKIELSQSKLKAKTLFSKNQL